jgi:hypothetical protein
MPLKIAIEQEGLIPKIGKRRIQQIKREALLHMAKRWHSRFHKDHFTAEGARKYHYRRRKTKDIQQGRIKKRSKKKYPGLTSGLPLVWTGATRGTAQSSTTFKSTYKQSHATAPLYTLNFKPGGINMRKEYTTVLQGEANKLAYDGQQNMRSHFRRKKKNISIRSI